MKCVGLLSNSLIWLWISKISSKTMLLLYLHIYNYTVKIDWQTILTGLLSLSVIKDILSQVKRLILYELISYFLNLLWWIYNAKIQRAVWVECMHAFHITTVRCVWSQAWLEQYLSVHWCPLCSQWIYPCMKSV